MYARQQQPHAYQKIEGVERESISTPEEEPTQPKQAIEKHHSRWLPPRNTVFATPWAPLSQTLGGGDTWANVPGHAWLIRRQNMAKRLHLPTPAHPADSTWTEGVPKTNKPGITRSHNRTERVQHRTDKRSNDQKIKI